jgi:hypothetical protein
VLHYTRDAPPFWELPPPLRNSARSPAVPWRFSQRIEPSTDLRWQIESAMAPPSVAWWQMVRRIVCKSPWPLSRRVLTSRGAGPSSRSASRSQVDLIVGIGTPPPLFCPYMDGKSAARSASENSTILACLKAELARGSVTGRLHRNASGCKLHPGHWRAPSPGRCPSGKPQAVDNISTIRDRTMDCGPISECRRRPGPL